jgi:hypothetical protein
MELLEVMETIKAEEASIGKLFGKEGTPTHNRAKGPEYAAKLAEAATFIAEVYSGKRPAYHLQEALTTSDFPNLFGDIIDRQLLGNYQETPQTFRAYSRIASVRDFRTVKRFFTNGSEAVLAAVPQQSEYPESKIDDGVYSYSVSKYGRRIPFSWETMINDDLDALKDIPARFGRAARRSEEKFATQLFADANGPHASFYTSGNKNQIKTANGAATSNPVLGIPGLQDGMKVLANQVDADSEPIYFDVVHLVIPPALEVTAQNIMNTTALWIGGSAGTQDVGSGGTAGTGLQTVNWMARRVQVHVNYYLPIVSTTNGGTSWYLFGEPSAARPALEVGFLRGHEMPEVFIKEGNQRRVGAGTPDAMDGDFDTDSIEYKVRHVLGGTRLEPKSTVASNGSGS